MKSERRTTWQRLGRASRKSALMMLLAILGTGRVWAQSGGTFTATGSMTTPRLAPTATLLTSGKVLIAGGVGVANFLYPGGGWLASAELYDPSTGTFSATGNMTTTRSGHTATLLPNGKVLIAGRGYTAASTPTVLPDGQVFFPPIYNASAELYDPSTGTFTATGDMTTVRFGYTATLLLNGNVLIAGGTMDGVDGADGHLLLASAELYDPSTEAFTPTGSMVTAQIGHKAILLTNGKVLIVDGYYGPLWPTVAGAELYDPSTGTFACTGDMTTQYYIGRTATLLTNGKVLVAGGDNDSSGTGSANAELYDPSTGTFTSTGDMTTGRQEHTATLLPDGTVLMAGSQRNDYGGGSALASAELYDPATDTFSATSDMTTPHFSHMATLLADGTVLMSGGSPGTAVILASAELYNPPSLTPAPVLFSLSGDGQGQGAILHSGTHQVASSSNPAIIAEALEIYCAGLVDGSVIPPQVAIGGRMAEILFFGKAPGQAPGWASLNQVDVRVPGGIAPGPAVPVRLTYLGRPSNEVTIAVR